MQSKTVVWSQKYVSSWKGITSRQLKFGVESFSVELTNTLSFVKMVPLCLCWLHLEWPTHFLVFSHNYRRRHIWEWIFIKGAISNGRLSRALQAMQKEGGTPHSDQRGRHEPSNKTSEASIRVVKEHIEMFPRYRSHYSRKANPHREYLSPDLSLTKLYSLYQDFCKENNHATVSEWVYRKVFTDQYNLFFGKWVCMATFYLLCLKQPAQATSLA